MFRCQVLGSPSLSTLAKERTLHLFLLARSLSSTVSYRLNNMCVVCAYACVYVVCVFVYVHMCALVCWNQSSMLDVSFSLKFLRQGLSVNLSHWVSSSPMLMLQTCPQLGFWRCGESQVLLLILCSTHWAISPVQFLVICSVRFVRFSACRCSAVPKIGQGLNQCLPL